MSNFKPNAHQMRTSNQMQFVVQQIRAHVLVSLMASLDPKLRAGSRAGSGKPETVTLAVSLATQVTKLGRSHIT